LLVAGSSGARGAAAGFGLGVTWWAYALKQCEALVLYLSLAVWPHPLVLDYGTGVVTAPSTVAPQLALLVLLVAVSATALWRRPALGFLGAWFFVVIAPSSSVVPLITQTVAEHRMYLPLASVAALAATGLVVIGGSRSLLLTSALAVAFGALTWIRNHDYRSELSIWEVTAIQQPDNPRVRMALGIALYRSGAISLGIEQLEAAIRLKPDFPEAHYNLGLALFRWGKTTEAITSYHTALQLRPNYADAHYNLGVALVQLGQVADAARHFEAAIHLRPLLGEAHSNLGVALARMNRPREAIPHLETAIRLDPRNAEAHNNLGATLRLLGNPEKARRHFETALRIQPDFALARENLLQLATPPR
jgi:tetratricopeptide (TPR) repeat protein